MIGNLAWPMSILMPLALLSHLPVRFGLFRRRSMAGFWLASAGLLLFGVALVVTLAVNVPIDNEIKRWTLATCADCW